MADAINDKEILSLFGQAVTAVDGLRQEELEELQVHLEAKQKMLERETGRLTAELGAAHPQVAAMKQRMAYHQMLGMGVQEELRMGKIKVKPADPDTWMIHGRVLDATRQGMEGLTAVVTDEQGKPIAGLETAPTDANGYFALRVKAGEKEKEKIEALRKQPVYISVYNAQKKLVSRNPVSLDVVAGRMEYREVVIAAKAKPNDIRKETGKKSEGKGNSETKHQK